MSAPPYTVIIAPEYFSDFEAMRSYYTDRKAPGAVRAASRGIDRLYKLLPAFPRLGAAWTPIAGRDGLRALPVQDHRLIYRVFDRQRSIVIVALLPTAFGEDRIRKRMRGR